jgi:hypothetical protein
MCAWFVKPARSGERTCPRSALTVPCWPAPILAQPTTARRATGANWTPPAPANARRWTRHTVPPATHLRPLARPGSHREAFSMDCVAILHAVNALPSCPCFRARRRRGSNSRSQRDVVVCERTTVQQAHLGSATVRYDPKTLRPHFRIRACNRRSSTSATPEPTHCKPGDYLINSHRQR